MKKMSEVVCPDCGKVFESSIPTEEKPLCFSCNLEGTDMEEGDINAARIKSGIMTDDEEADLLEAWRAIEEGRSVHEYFDDFSSDDERCPGCWHYTNDCRCP